MNIPLTTIHLSAIQELQKTLLALDTYYSYQKKRWDSRSSLNINIALFF